MDHRLLRTVAALLLVFIAFPSRAEFTFDCHYDISPISPSASPTFWSEMRMTTPEIFDPTFAPAATLTNTAHVGTFTQGPFTVVGTHPAPPITTWLLQNVFAFPAFTAYWRLSARLDYTRTFVLEFGAVTVPFASFCASEGLISPPGSGGGGGGGCMIVDPADSILTLSGEVEALPKALHRQPLTQKRLAEDGREIVTDQYRLVGGNSPVADSMLIASSRPASLLIRHQRMHPANHNYAPTPHVTFTPQPYADPSAQGQRGFAVVDFGESGRVLNVRVLPGDSGVAPRVLTSAITKAVHTEFEDHRRHDHRAYLAYRIEGRTLHLEGEPIVTMPLCCGPPIGCPPPPYHCY